MSHGATIGGGKKNKIADADSATIGGGENNTIDYGSNATIAGGYSNNADGPYATVGGGERNVAYGVWSTVPGGCDNRADGVYSYAAGRRAKAMDNGCFVWGDSTDADIHSSKEDQFIVRASGGVYFYTNSGLSSGQKLPAGSGSWSSFSDGNLKEHFTQVDRQEILARLAEIPITTWNYKTQDPTIRHIGPIAQDFYSAFGLGEDNLHISTVDADGIALVSIQELYQMLQEKDQQIEQLNQKLEETGRQLENVRSQLQVLEQLVKEIQQNSTAD